MTITSPKSVDGENGATNNKGGQCLCSPTTHQGSFRCRFHRPKSSSWMMKRSYSMPITRSSNTTTTKSTTSDHTQNSVSSMSPSLNDSCT
ncbi:hypothetical protein RND81_08G056400 [Saponaria officinalis]|uniref:Uncharacterized protein n=1 Tax=Saponaria officinalis TaxID=3572 RepID=A0AAW1J4E5_SAPOF